MPILQRLRSAGFAVRPFDAPRRPCVVKIYPRVLTGLVNKRSAEAREGCRDRHHPTMDAARDELATLPTVRDPRSRREGRIGWPTGAAGG